MFIYAFLYHQNWKSTYFIFPSHKIIVGKFVYIGNSILSHEGPAGRCEIQQWLLYVLCWPSNPLSPNFYLFFYVERAIYTESWGTILQYTVSLGLVTYGFSPHHPSSSATSSPSFILPWERVSWPCFRLALCLFLARSPCSGQEKPGSWSRRSEAHN